MFFWFVVIIISFFRPGFERASRKARDLAAQYNLGNPVAGNLFQAEHEGWWNKTHLAPLKPGFHGHKQKHKHKRH